MSEQINAELKYSEANKVSVRWMLIRTSSSTLPSPMSSGRFCWNPGECWNSTVLYTPTACPTDSVGRSSDPAISNGLTRQSIGSPSESVGHDWIPLLVQAKSSESPLKPLKSKKWLDWLEFCVRWTSTGLPPDFCWISAGLRQKPVIFAKSSVHWTSDGLLGKKAARGC